MSVYDFSSVRTDSTSADPEVQKINKNMFKFSSGVWLDGVQTGCGFGNADSNPSAGENVSLEFNILYYFNDFIV